MQRTNSISIICSQHSFSFTDISLRYSLMHFQTSISLFIINPRMFCLTFFYLPFFSIKALCEEMLSSHLPRAWLLCPFPVKRSYWHTSSISSLPNQGAVQLHSHRFSLFGLAKSQWKEEGWLESVYTASPLLDWQQSHSNAPGEAQDGASPWRGAGK